MEAVRTDAAIFDAQQATGNARVECDEYSPCPFRVPLMPLRKSALLGQALTKGHSYLTLSVWSLVATCLDDYKSVKQAQSHTFTEGKGILTQRPKGAKAQAKAN
jgi:hypothetical protein